ncbi:MAG: NigD-like protein [Tannerella sp.]|jgi:hypothetical protein|nr:NigD-like protein [Tannerella sp.]
MKLIRLIYVCAGVLAASCVFNSCNDSEGYSLDNVWYSMATVVPSDDSPAYHLRLDRGTTLWPAASSIPWYAPTEKHRALVYYTVLSDAFQGYDHAVKVLDIRDVLTKPVAGDRGGENDSYYGTDPVRILDLWIGDGYLNVEFGFGYGGNVRHFINLVKREGGDTPSCFEFRHNAYGDNVHVQSKGIVSFDLSSLEVEGEDLQLVIRAKTPEGEKDYTVTYRPESSGSVAGSVERTLSGNDFTDKLE